MYAFLSFYSKIKGLHKALFSVTLISTLYYLITFLKIPFLFLPTESFMVLSFIFVSQIHLELIFVSGKSDFPIDPAPFVQRHH